MHDWWWGVRLRLAMALAGTDYRLVDAEKFDGMCADLGSAESYLSRAGSVNDGTLKRRPLKRLHRWVGRATADSLNAEGFPLARAGLLSHTEL